MSRRQLYGIRAQRAADSTEPFLATLQVENHTHRAAESRQYDITVQRVVLGQGDHHTAFPMHLDRPRVGIDDPYQRTPYLRHINALSLTADGRSSGDTISTTKSGTVSE